MITILLLGLVSIASAQVSEIVGFSRDDNPAGLYIRGMQFDHGTTNSPVTLYKNDLPLGSKFHKWTGEATGYQVGEYEETTWAWDLNPEVMRGEGYWVESTGVYNAMLSGVVYRDESVTYPILDGQNLLSFPYPVDRVVTNLGFNPVLGDKVYVFDESLQRYSISTYRTVMDWSDFPPVAVGEDWDLPSLEIPAGQGFFYVTTNATTWTAERPFDLGLDVTPGLELRCSSWPAGFTKLEGSWPMGYSDSVEIFGTTDLVNPNWGLVDDSFATSTAYFYETIDTETFDGVMNKYYVLASADEDSDADGLSDAREVLLHNTNPMNADPDEDGVLDGVEIQRGTDPNDSQSANLTVYANSDDGSAGYDGYAASYTSGTHGPKGDRLQDAIDASVSGDTIELSGTANFTDALISGNGKEITLKANGNVTLK